MDTNEIRKQVEERRAKKLVVCSRELIEMWREACESAGDRPRRWPRRKGKADEAT